MRDHLLTDRIRHIEFRSSTTTWEEIEDYATCIEGTITCLEERGKDKLMGRLRLFYLDLGATYDTNISIFDLFDLRAETTPFYSALIDHETGDFRSDLQEEPGEYGLGLNLLIDRLEILPEFRGRRLDSRVCDGVYNSMRVIVEWLP